MKHPPIARRDRYSFLGAQFAQHFFQFQHSFIYVMRKEVTANSIENLNIAESSYINRKIILLKFSWFRILHSIILDSQNFVSSDSGRDFYGYIVSYTMTNQGSSDRRSGRNSIYTIGQLFRRQYSYNTALPRICIQQTNF